MPLARGAGLAYLGAMDVLSALDGRQSIRGFRPDEVPRELLEEVFLAAQRAPSWCNIQPWRVWLMSGTARQVLKARLTEAAMTRAPGPEVDFPPTYPEPYQTHRRECAKTLYRAMDVKRDDNLARQAAWMRNFSSFDAPHVAIVGVDTRLGFYVGVDVGCWLQSVLLAAHARGLAACPQASVSIYPEVIRELAPVPSDVSILFGIALGYPDPEHPANGARTERSSLEDNVVFVD